MLDHFWISVAQGQGTRGERPAKRRGAGREPMRMSRTGRALGASAWPLGA